jgi:hypothetical protein
MSTDRTSTKVPQPASAAAQSNKNATGESPMSADRTSTKVPQPANQNFDRQHRFKPGHTKFGGRRKGTRNVTTNRIGEALLAALELLGEDEKGKNGMIGFFVRVGRKDPTALANMAVAKVMPIQEIEKSELEQTDAPRIVPVYCRKEDEDL